MLEFDAYQRNETVKRILQSISLQKSALLLDVGGYPGRLRSVLPEYQWVICDPLVDAPGDQVIGDAARLPFQDDVFEMAVSLDVVEHIQPQDRFAFVQEINRVSRNGFILSFPHNHPLVVQTEMFVCQAYGKKYPGKEHPWLHEHSEYGLPNADELMLWCMQSGLKIDRIDVGAIHRWLQLQLFGMLIENKPLGIEIADEVDEYYKDSVYPNEFIFPSYRTILVALENGTPFNLNDPLPTAQQNDHEIAVELQAFLAMQYERAIEYDNGKKERASQLKELSSDEVVEYISRLETGLRMWEDSYARLHQRLFEEMQWRDKIENSRIFKILRTLKRLIKI